MIPPPSPRVGGWFLGVKGLPSTYGAISKEENVLELEPSIPGQEVFRMFLSHSVTGHLLALGAVGSEVPASSSALIWYWSAAAASVDATETQVYVKHGC